MQYIVEHLEGDLEKWPSLEYAHMCECVGEHALLLTNCPASNIKRFQELSNSTYSPSMTPETLESLKGTMDWNRTCLLDLNAPAALSPKDAKLFNVLVLGGILGNVPPDDRTSLLRRLDFDCRRHLGEKQMTTDTALLVAKIVLEDQTCLEEIPYVDHPELPLTSKESVELPFRYVALSYRTKDPKDADTPILPKGMLEYLKYDGSWPDS